MDLPRNWQRRFAEATLEQQTIGESRADVWRIASANSAPLFVKSEQVMQWGELPGEVARLRWMESQNLPAPRVLDTATELDKNWLLMTAVPGRDLASSPHLAPQRERQQAVHRQIPRHRLAVVALGLDR